MNISVTSISDWTFKFFFYTYWIENMFMVQPWNRISFLFFMVLITEKNLKNSLPKICKICNADVVTNNFSKKWILGKGLKYLILTLTSSGNIQVNERPIWSSKLLPKEDSEISVESVSLRKRERERRFKLLLAKSW